MGFQLWMECEKKEEVDRLLFCGFPWPVSRSEGGFRSEFFKYEKMAVDQ